MTNYGTLELVTAVVVSLVLSLISLAFLEGISQVLQSIKRAWRE